MTGSPLLTWYRRATDALGGLASVWLDARVQGGKEDAARIGERYGRAERARPEGRLVWLHAASVGESGVALMLADALRERDQRLSFLISTGTRTSADLVARRANARTRHVYAPIDRPDAVKAFLAHWRPDLGVFVESEVWPNLILEARARGARLALVNARMSQSTLGRWRRWPKAGAELFGAFDTALAADQRTADLLSTLRGASAPCLGNLKLAAPAPHYEQAARAALEMQIGARPFWLAASTHRGEEEILLEAHRMLRAERSDALLIIVPRHPERGAEVAKRAGEARRRALAQEIGDAPVYVADTLGELGLFYALAPAAFIGGSLLPALKGHNPIEPAKLGAPILSGPHVESFEDVFAILSAAGAATIASTPSDIAGAVSALWRDAALRGTRAEAAARALAQGEAALITTIAALGALLPQETAQNPIGADASA